MRVPSAVRGISWVKVAGIGNVLRHEYERTAPDILSDGIPTTRHTGEGRYPWQR